MSDCRILALLALLPALLWPALTPAECLKDRLGEVYCGAGRCERDREGVVWCSRFDDGDARVDRDGAVLCGRGRCASTLRGDVFCSTVPGGAALKDREGRVRCEGSCEAASAALCESTVAGSAR